VRILFVPHGWEDYLHWQATDRRMLRKINELIAEITRGEPFEGIEKP